MSVQLTMQATRMVPVQLLCNYYAMGLSIATLKAHGSCNFKRALH